MDSSIIALTRFIVAIAQHLLSGQFRPHKALSLVFAHNDGHIVDLKRAAYRSMQLSELVTYTPPVSKNTGHMETLPCLMRHRRLYASAPNANPRPAAMAVKDPCTGAQFVPFGEERVIPARCQIWSC